MSVTTATIVAMAILLLVTLLFVWLIAEHIVERHLENDWKKFWDDWFLIVVVGIAATAMASSLLSTGAKALLWIMAL